MGTEAFKKKKFIEVQLIYNVVLIPGIQQASQLSMKVKVARSRPTSCNPMDFTVPGILQARILEWVAFPFSRASSQPRDQTQVSRITGRFFTS